MSNPQEFDQFAEKYDQLLDESVKLSGESSAFFVEQKIELMARGGNHVPLGRFLDFGCGVGNAFPFVQKHFPGWSYDGVDVSEESIRTAREKQTGGTYAVIHPPTLDFPDATFDRVMAAVVFHHIPFGEHPAALAEIFRVLKPGGRFFLFEHNPWCPPTRRVVASCPFDKDAVLLPPPYATTTIGAAGFAEVRRQFYLFFPKVLGVFRPLESLMGWIPIGAQYLVEGCRPLTSTTTSTR